MTRGSSAIPAFHLRQETERIAQSCRKGRIRSVNVIGTWRCILNVRGTCFWASLTPENAGSNRMMTGQYIARTSKQPNPCQHNTPHVQLGERSGFSSPIPRVSFPAKDFTQRVQGYLVAGDGCSHSCFRILPPSDMWYVQTRPMS